MTTHEAPTVRIGVVSVSDRASAGIYEDKGIPALQAWLGRALRNPVHWETRLIPDEQPRISEALRELVDTARCDLVLTTGGTGPAPRDVTPEATLAVADKVMPGFGEQMRAISLRFVPTAILSRQVAVIRGKTLIINLPGQPKSIAETLEGLPNASPAAPGIFAAVPYCIDLIGGPYMETNPAVCVAFRPKTAPRPPWASLSALALATVLCTFGPAGEAQAKAQRAAPTSSAASEPAAVYTVAAGDSLVTVAQRLLVRPGAWPEVARFNRLSQPNLIHPGQSLHIPLRLLRAEDLPARLLSVEGDVRIGPALATVGSLLTVGQILSTAPHSSAVLVLADGSVVSVAPTSQTQLAENRRYALRLSPTQAGRIAEAQDGSFAAAMRLLKGSLELLATKLGRPKPLEVSTPVAVIGVRGTQYRVHHDDSQVTRTEVLAGAVRADPAGNAAQGANVAAGFGSTLRAGQPVRVIALPTAPDLSGLPSQVTEPRLRLTLPDAGGMVRVQLAADPEFRRVVRDERMNADGTLSLAGLADATWQLRVRRVDRETGIEGLDAQRSLVLSTVQRDLPAGPVGRPVTSATAPADVVLDWTDEWPDADASRYRVQVARDAAFGHIVHQLDSVAEKSASVALTLPGAYWWRVARLPRSAADRSGESAWSVGRFDATPAAGAAAR